jgi:hypothetical protein
MMPTYHPKVLGSVEALQWTGDWEAMSLFCYGDRIPESETFYESGAPVVVDGNYVSVLGLDGEVTIDIGGYVERYGNPGFKAVFKAWPADEFEAAFHVSWDGTPV